jgi:glucose-1-phosphate thymidylyltransferase
MRAIIPVAGVGSRLRPHTFTVPKVLLNVAGKPILGHIIDKVRGEGITEATIVVGHMGDKIMEYVARTYPKFNVDYVEQEERLGLGHAIFLARNSVGDNPVLIILGDTIFDVDLAPVLRGNASALGVKAVEDPRRFGVAETRDGFITRLVEKPELPATNLAVVGLYFIRNTPLLRECLMSLVNSEQKTRGEFQLTDALQLMIDRGEKMVPFTIDGWYDCGKPETLLETNRALLQKHSTSQQLPGVVVNDPVYIAPSAVLANCIIGPNTTVGDNAEISDSLVKNSIISENAKVTGALLENSIIGNGSVLTGSYRRINVGDSSEIDFF